MSSYQLARHSSLHRVPARTMEVLSGKMLFGTWKMSAATGRKDKALGGCETLLFHTNGWCNQDLQPLKAFSTLAQLQPSRANYQTTPPRHKHVSLKAVRRGVACISLIQVHLRVSFPEFLHAVKAFRTLHLLATAETSCTFKLKAGGKES